MDQNRLANKKTKAELLEDLKKESFKRRTLSFYKYVNIQDSEKMRDLLFVEFEKLQCLGRIYVAHEGINAQMNVPEHNWKKFIQLIKSIPEFADVPFKIAVEEPKESFIKLVVKNKKKILYDGIDDPNFDPSNTGAYLNAQEFNMYTEDTNNCVVIDMRNSYESEIGHFKNALTPEALTFREEIAKLSEILKDKEDKKIAMYCTGGIRCEKASAYLKHKGFKDVKHLKGGIIDYARQIKEEGLENKFIGSNFVFDERMGEKISNDIISTCHICKKTKSDKYINCANDKCHRLIITCPNCEQKYGPYCSLKCKVFDKIENKNVKKFVGKILFKQKSPLEKYKKKS